MEDNDNGKFVPFKTFFWGIDGIRSEFCYYDAVINAANKLSDYYEEMHKKGVFGGIDDSCININTLSGELKIKRKQGDTALKYKAPELIRNPSLRDCEQSDNFTLAVLLFRIFFTDHPFEGRIDYAVAPFLSKKISEMLYGFEPVFVYSESDDSNRPLGNLSPYLTMRWNEAPQILRDAFMSVFTYGVGKPELRLNSSGWRDIINKITDICVDTDNGIVFVDPDKTDEIPPECVIIKIGDRKVVLADGSALTVSYSEKSAPLTAEVFEQDGQNILVIENITDDTWIVYDCSGAEDYIKPNEYANLYKGYTIDFGIESGTVI